jgi:hypothetical protein
MMMSHTFWNEGSEDGEVVEGRRGGGGGRTSPSLGLQGGGKEDEEVKMGSSRD